MRVVPLWLRPGNDLRLSLEDWMGRQQEQAGWQRSITITGKLEILSLSGTLSPDGAHLHIAVADSTGAVIGGHLCLGLLVRTTAKLVIGLLPEWQFSRELDEATGFAELLIHQPTDMGEMGETR